MKGHEGIIAMRRSGKKPTIVFLNDYPCKIGGPTDHATVDVAGDQPEWLDLRYLVGLTVSISASSEKRSKRFMQACINAGAAVVAAGSAEKVNGRYEAVWGDVWRK
jgi:hypothetical protein